jgi:hypothetical protein
MTKQQMAKRIGFHVGNLEAHISCFWKKTIKKKGLMRFATNSQVNRKKYLHQVEITNYNSRASVYRIRVDSTPGVYIPAPEKIVNQTARFPFKFEFSFAPSEIDHAVDAALGFLRWMLSQQEEDLAEWMRNRDYNKLPIDTVFNNLALYTKPHWNRFDYMWTEKAWEQQQLNYGRQLKGRTHVRVFR